MRDYSIFDRFGFERKPVGVSFSLKKPEGLRQLDKALGICEMFKEAQTSEPFYAAVENVQCGTQVMGMAGFPPVMESGQLGSEFSMFKTPSANRRVYDYVPVMPRDSVRYIVHSSLDKLTFDPDILIITANPAQAEILLQGQQLLGRPHVERQVAPPAWPAPGSTPIPTSRANSTTASAAWDSV